MAQERRHKSRSRRRRGRFGFFYKLLSVLLVAAALTTACVVFFRVNNITVIGNSRYTVQEVIEASGIQQGDNLITLSPSRVAARIRLRLPYVSSVSIRRALPDTVVLEIEDACRRSGHLGWKGMVVYRGPGQGTGAGRFPGFGDVCHGTDRPGPCSGRTGCGRRRAGFPAGVCAGPSDGPGRAGDAG